jgi:hypothetical protein
MANARNPIAKAFREAIGHAQSHVNRLHQELELLREIDQFILGATDFDTVFPFFVCVMNRIKQLVNGDIEYAIYFRNNGSFKLLEESVHDIFLKSIPSSLFRNIASSSDKRCRVKPLSSVLDVTKTDIKFANEALLFTFYYNGERVGAFAFTQIANGGGNRVGFDKLSRDAIVRIGTQLQIAFQTIRLRHVERVTLALTTSVLDEAISPDRAFRRLANQIPRYFLRFGPVSQKKRVYINIVSYDENSRTLTVRGSNGVYDEMLSFSRHHSITGLLFQDENSDQDLIDLDLRDPKYADRYQKFLNERPAEREIILRLTKRARQGEPKRTIGVLNFEFENYLDYDNSQTPFISEISDEIGYIFDLVMMRLNNSILNSKGSSSTIASYLNTIAHKLEHDAITKISALSELPNLVKKSDNIDEIKGFISEYETQLKSLNAVLIAFLDIITDADIRYDVNTRDISRLVKMFLDVKSSEARKYGIEFALNLDESRRGVQATKLFDLHLISVFENSWRSLCECVAKDPERKGVIIIDLAKRRIPSKDGDIEFDVLTISDTGDGVPSEQLSRLQEGALGTRFSAGNGQGYTLFALRRYMIELGGSLEIDSEFGRSFTVRMHFIRSDGGA